LDIKGQKYTFFVMIIIIDNNLFYNHHFTANKLDEKMPVTKKDTGIF